MICTKAQKKTCRERAGLGDGRAFYKVQPEPQPNKVTKVEIKNKKLSKEKSARTTDDRSTKDEEMHVSPAIAKPAVVRRFSSTLS